MYKAEKYLVFHVYTKKFTNERPSLAGYANYISIKPEGGKRQF